MIQVITIDSWLSGANSPVTLSDHNARITCMRWVVCGYLILKSCNVYDILIVKSGHKLQAVSTE